MGSPFPVEVNPVPGQGLSEGSGTEGDESLPFETAFLQVVVNALGYAVVSFLI